MGTDILNTYVGDRNISIYIILYLVYNVIFFLIVSNCLQLYSNKIQFRNYTNDKF